MALRVFLVEYSKALGAHLMEMLVARARVEIAVIAQTEDQAIDWLDRNADRWDILLVDLFLDEGKGVGVIEHCQDRRPGQRGLVMSHHPRNDGLLHRCKQLGADACLPMARAIEDSMAVFA